MNILKKMSFRFFQKVLHLSMYFLPFKEPLLFEGEAALENLIIKLKQLGFKKIFIVTDPNIVKLSFYNNILKKLEDNDFLIKVFKETKPNPSIQQIEIAYNSYRDFSPNMTLAIGGGSSIDLAKGIGIRVTHKNKSLQSRKGILKVLKKQPFLVAMPTTAGTGSEATVACVVTDEFTNEKYAINDPVLIPKIAVLDPKTCFELPKNITATTGMDALTHAVEAYLGNSNTKKTKIMAKSAIKLINENLLNAYYHGENMSYRENMLKASYQAGVAFTRAYVGNIHAIAHQLGGMYNIPHGLANAIIMPYVLEYYGKNVEKKLFELNKLISSNSENNDHSNNAREFIKWIKNMNKEMNIPEKIKLDGDKEKMVIMTRRAYKEANPLYPVPVIFDEDDFMNILDMITE
ncbi:MAG: iron-containing alcohol dehydrogenase [Candidatus Izemoplasmatales bacterium]